VTPTWPRHRSSGKDERHIGDAEEPAAVEPATAGPAPARQPGGVVSRWHRAWHRLSRLHRVLIVITAVAVVACCLAAARYLQDRDGLAIVDPAHPGYSYAAVFVLVALDAVIPIFPGETTLNAASTAAAQGTLDLLPVIVMGAVGAVVGDSALFWIARRSARRVAPTLDRAKANNQVRQALAIMSSSAPALIVGGRYVPGMRFVVNATMGLSDMAYGRFLRWSVLSGILWSTYTCALAYWIGRALGEFPLASIVISGLVTTAALAVVLLSVRRHRRAAAALEGAR
jgi:membrane-associated protein